MKKKQTKKWVLPRHRRATKLVDFFLRGYVRRKYGLNAPVFEGREGRNYLILMNHVTGFDQFFVGFVFKGQPVYYVASEDIFSLGLASRIIKYLVNPIPIKKQSTDARAVINCIRVAKEGGNIAIAPEGNRTFSGRTGYFNPAIAALAKKLGLPIAFFRIENGYGVHPRWADDVRKGQMKAYVSRVLEPEEYGNLSDTELCELIGRELYVDEACLSGEFLSKRSAEYIERLLYVCPKCGFSSFLSEGQSCHCTKCGLNFKVTKTKELKFAGEEQHFRFVADWYNYQENFVNSRDTSLITDTPLYTDTVSLSRVIPYRKKKKVMKTATSKLYGDRIEILGKEHLTIPFSEASVVTVLGKNKINIYHKSDVYQLKGDKRLCAVKYMNLFHRYKNVLGGNNSEFLGL